MSARTAQRERAVLFPLDTVQHIQDLIGWLNVLHGEGLPIGLRLLFRVIAFDFNCYVHQIPL